MKTITFLSLILALALTPTAFAQTGKQPGNHGPKTHARSAYDLTNVIISSLTADSPMIVTVTQGNHATTFKVTDKTKFYTVVNGKRSAISSKDGKAMLKVGATLSVVAKQSRKGIIAVLIAL
jgi:hypothetical protein